MPTPHDTAAFWFARLNAPDCSEQDRENFSVWYHQHTANAQAYELVSSIWRASGKIASHSGETPLTIAAYRFSRRKMLAGAIAMAVGSFALLPAPAEATIRATRTGQQIRLSVSPAMTILLDSDSSVAIHSEKNTLDLLYGQVEVKLKNSGARNTINLDQWNIGLIPGTFNLSKSSLKSTITVLNGAAALAHPDMAGSQILKAGERATILPDNRLLIDRPSLEDVLAWRSGRLAFRDTPLREVADEMNRYSTRKLEVSPSAANLRISGFYHFGQNETFARLLENFLPIRASFEKTITIVKL